MADHKPNLLTRLVCINCTMCSDTNECPECGADDVSDDCTMCFGSGECPECGGNNAE